MNVSNHGISLTISDMTDFDTKLVMCSVSTNGERASLVNLKMTIGSLLECS